MAVALAAVSIVPDFGQQILRSGRLCKSYLFTSLMRAYVCLVVWSSRWPHAFPPVRQRLVGVFGTDAPTRARLDREMANIRNTLMSPAEGSVSDLSTGGGR